MRPRVLLTRRIFPEVLARLRAAATVDCPEEDADLPKSALAGRLAGVSALMSMLTDRIDAQVLAAAPGLRVVSNVAVGYNNIDIDACTAAGVMVTNTPGVLDETTADLVWALLMASARRIAAADRWVRAGQWQGWQLADPWLGQDIHGATLGILGMGRIGQAVARRAQGFGMRVLCHNRTPGDVSGARWVGLPTLLAEADYLVLLVPYSAATHHLIGARELAQMKPSAHLINAARGGVVDDVALIAALQSGRLGGAALDVFEHEPRLHPDFLTLDNVTLTPHIGSSTRATRLAMAQCAADNLLAALRGERPPNLVNPEVLAR